MDTTQRWTKLNQNSLGELKFVVTTFYLKDSYCQIVISLGVGMFVE